MTNTQTMKTITLCKEDWDIIMANIQEQVNEYGNGECGVLWRIPYDNLLKTYDKSPDLIMEYKEDGLMEMHQAHTYGNPVE